MGTVESNNRGGINRSSMHSSIEDDDSNNSIPSELPQELTSKYEVVCAIGKGAFGSVYKIRDKTTRIIYAAKHLINIPSNREEAQIQAGLEDDHIVKVFDTLDCGHDLILIMEYCEGGNLLEWIKRNRRHKGLNEKVILQMLVEICEAVLSCHKRKIIHRDIKPENILLDSRRRVKLGDFGVARKLNKHSFAKSFCGTPPYMAPELFLSYLSNPGGFGTTTLGYDGKCDVWSIGCILYDMANDQNRFVYDLQSSLGFDAARKPSDTLIEKDITELVEVDIPKEFSICKRLLHLMLVKSPSQRISLLDILQDKQLRNCLENPQNGHWSDMLDRLEHT